MKKLLFLIATSMLMLCSVATTAFSQTTEPVKNVSPSGKMVFFPNPSNGSFQIRMPELTAESEIEITIYNELGDIVFTTKGSGNIANIDIRNQKNGIYTVYVIGDGFMNSSKVILSK